MQKLITFGCSYTAGFLSNGSIPLKGSYRDYYDWRGGNFPKTYPELLSEQNNLQLHNYASQGSSNSLQFWKATESYHTWNKDDIIVFQSTFVQRLEFLNSIIDGYEWHILESDPHPSTEKTYNPSISYKAQEELLISRDNILQNREVIAYVRAMKALADAKQCHFLWVPFDTYSLEYVLDREKECRDVIDLMVTHTPKDGTMTIIDDLPEEIKGIITEETNGIVDDNHYGEIGNKTQAEIISPYLRRFL